MLMKESQEFPLPLLVLQNPAWRGGGGQPGAGVTQPLSLKLQIAQIALIELVVEISSGRSDQRFSKRVTIE